MSTTSRSQSSSPDILGPPGDTEYLISSPIKPFTGRQSFLSPATVRRQRTPAKRSRVSLSPAKSAHSIQFGDVMLPGSPTMKLNGRQRSLSPEKIQSDGNVSPWRIRVTLEATQDEENENQGSPARKRLRPSTVTTKVPLKDDRSPLQEKTPARRRGRPRKSDTQPQNGSPWPRSPGNTPGPKGGSSQKGQRGQPRKGTPKPKAQEIPVAEEEPTPVPAPEPAQEADLHFSPMDTAADGGNGSSRQWSPMNLTANGLDSDSLGADDLPIANLRAPAIVADEEHWDDANTASRDFGRATYDTPVIGATEHHFLDHDENIHSTPSKMPSPTRERSASSARSERHVDSNSPQRTYPPTPTSSLGEEEDQSSQARLGDHPETDERQFRPDSTADPTEQHEEYDSIMESEGFTMISLDTLPSVKQHGLGSSARTGTDSSSNRDNGRIGKRLKRQLPGGIGELRSDNQNSARPSPVAVDPSPRLKSFAQPELEQPIRHSPAEAAFYPELPATSPQKPQDVSELEQAPVYPTLPDEEQAEEDVAESIEAPVDDNEEDIEDEEEGDEDEVEVIDPSPRIERREPAQNSPMSLQKQREEVWHMERQAVSQQARDPRNEPRLIYIDSDDNGSPAQAGTVEILDDRLQSVAESDVESHEDIANERHVEEEEMEEVEEKDASKGEYVEDWAGGPVEEAENLERNHVQEQFANERSDHISSEAYEDDEDGSVDMWQQEFQYSKLDQQDVRRPLSTIDETTEMEQEVGDNDNGFDDIWQQEARDNSHLSQSPDDRHVPAEAAASAWRRIAGSYANQSHLSSSPAYVTMEHSDANHQEPTHIRKLRDEEVDLSALLAEEDTPNRARYYNGTSTPRSLLSRRSGAQNSSINGSVIKSDPSRTTGQRARLQPISQSSPEMPPEVEVESPASNSERSLSESQSEEIDETGDVSDEDVQEDESVHERSVATPQHPRQAEEPAPTSSLFQRIASLTPRWLKAPNRAEEDSSSEDESEQNDQEDVASIESAKEIRENLEHVPSPPRSSESPRYFDELAGLARYDREDDRAERESSAEGEEEAEERDDEVDDAHEQQSTQQGTSTAGVEHGADGVVDLTGEEHDKPAGPRPLAAFGYFSDDHYRALRRVYRMATRYPEQFPYHDGPGRAKIIGDWIWTSDGRHGVPITEIQFAIIDRFVHDLSRADVRYGGSGQVDWTEADLHRRLISIIIGEQIREERKIRANRGASVDTWR